MEKETSQKLAAFVAGRAEAERCHVDASVSPLPRPRTSGSPIRVAMADALATASCIALIGPPGSGKTEALEHACLSAAQNRGTGKSDPHPVLVQAKEFAPSSVHDMQSLILDWLPAGVDLSSVSVLLLVDGVDEGGRSSSHALLDALMRLNAGARARVARTIAATRWPDSPLLGLGFTGFEMLPFNDQQVRAYVEAAVPRSSQNLDRLLLESWKLGRMARFPLFLSGIAKSYAASELAYAPGVSSLLPALGRTIQYLVASVALQSQVPIEVLYEFLGRLAAQLEVSNQEELPASLHFLDDFERSFGAALSGRAHEVVSLMMSARLLAQTKYGQPFATYAFHDAAVREFFFADYIRRRLGTRDSGRLAMGAHELRLGAMVVQDWRSVDALLRSLASFTDRLRSVEVEPTPLYARHGSLYVLLSVSVFATYKLLDRLAGAFVDRLGEKLADRLLPDDEVLVPPEALEGLPEWLTKNAKALRAYADEYAREYANEAARRDIAKRAMALVIEAAADETLGGELTIVAEELVIEGNAERDRYLGTTMPDQTSR